MRREAHTVWPLLISFLIFGNGFAQRGGGNGTIIGVGPTLGLYRLHTRHAVSPAGRPGLNAGVRREIRADRQYRTFFQFGAEFFLHGLTYNSYLFDPDTFQLYDKSFGYRYTLYVQELHLPLQLKFLFNRGDNKLYSPYACVAYHVRYLLQSSVEVDEYGNRMRKDHPEMKFRTFLLYEKVNAFVSAGMGWQRNKISDKGTAFFAELTFRYGFSDYFFERPFAANSVFISGSHLTLMLGLKL